MREKVKVKEEMIVYFNWRRRRLNSITNEKKKKPTIRWWWRWKHQLRILDFERESVMEGTREWISLIYIYIFTGSKILSNKWVRINYIIYIKYQNIYIYFIYSGVFIVITIWLLVSSSFHSWCYWVFFVVC